MYLSVAEKSINLLLDVYILTDGQVVISKLTTKSFDLFISIPIKTKPCNIFFCIIVAYSFVNSLLSVSKM